MSLPDVKGVKKRHDALPIEHIREHLRAGGLVCEEAALAPRVQLRHAAVLGGDAARRAHAAPRCDAQGAQVRVRDGDPGVLVVVRLGLDGACENRFGTAGFSPLFLLP